MQEEAEACCSTDFDYVPLEILNCEGSSRSRSLDSQSIVELGKQLLHYAKIGDTDMVRDLMCRGAPFTTDWLGTSALHFAAQNNHLETAEVLLRAGISRDARTKVDRTPLHMATYEGHQQMVQLLLNYGAEVDSRDMLKMTPLHWAVEQEHPAVMLTLLEHGADPNSICKFNRSPVSLAIEHNRPDFLELLQQEREVVNIPETNMQTTEFEPQTQNLIQPEVEQQEQEEIQLDKLHEKRKTKQKTTNANKKQKFMYHRINQPVEVEQDTDDLQRLQEKTIHLENNKNLEFINLSEIDQPLKFLQAHGLTMIPIDNDATIVENAMESGQTVVLTEAGKLALNLTRSKPINITPIKRVQVNNKKGASKKVITIRADQIINQNQPSTSSSRGPNILKRTSNDARNAGKIYITPVKKPTPSCTKTSVTKIKNVITPKQEPILLQLDDEVETMFEDSNDRELITDIVELNRKLAEAQKEINEYRIKLKKKEEEAELYKQQLTKLVAHKNMMKQVT